MCLNIFLRNTQFRMLWLAVCVKDIVVWVLLFDQRPGAKLLRRRVVYTECQTNNSGKVCIYCPV